MSDEKRRQQRRTKDTEAKYAKRFGQLWKRAIRERHPKLTLPEFAAWLPTLHASLKPASRRQYQAASLFFIQRLGERDKSLRTDADEALALLVTTLEDGKRRRQHDSGGSVARLNTAFKTAALKTSAAKSRQLSDFDFDKIIAEANRSSSQYAEALIASMEANILVGLRPIEWYGTRITRAAGALILVVPNAKNTNGRSHGPTRTIIFEQCDASIESALRNWHEQVNGLSFYAYQKLLKSVEERLRIITRILFPTRKRRPTPYTVRHAVSARLKAAYIGTAKNQEERDHGAAIVAALMGHAVDTTASHHYGNASSKGGRRYPIAKADPTEVARIRPNRAKSRAKLQHYLENSAKAGPRL